MTEQSAVVGPIRLELPPISTMSRVARLTATAIASMVGFSIDEIDDVNVVVSELMVALVEHGAHDTIVLIFDVTDGCFTVRAATEMADFNLNHPDLALCRTVLAAVSTSHGIEGDGERAEMWAKLQQSSS